VVSNRPLIKGPVFFASAWARFAVSGVRLRASVCL